MVNLVKPIFAYSTPATADMWSIPEGKAYSVDVPGIYRKFVVHTGAGTTIVTGTMWYNSPAELSEAGYVTSMRSDGCLMITFFDEATVQATGRDEAGRTSDKSYEVIDTLIEAGSWKSTPQPERPYPNITPAVADLDHTSGWISIYSISAPLIQKKFTKKAGTGKRNIASVLYQFSNSDWPYPARETHNGHVNVHESS
ncbi:hypothetical protein FRC10_004492 [Ceratobasidium sp. 414]|nr:hypothetical protein FRC10_004492 [Ceratobasidium sp. 414]